MFFYSRFNFGLLCFSAFLVRLICGQLSYCPDPAGTLPYCNCSKDTSGRITLDCSLAQDEKQLEEYFSTTVFPTYNFYLLNISNNQDLKYLGYNVFGEVTFQIIYLYKDAIEYINDSVFVNSKFTLVTWQVNYCNLSSVAQFPFSSLRQYSKLSDLNLYHAGVFDDLPRIDSTSLTSLNMGYCELQNIPIGVFDDLPKLETLYLYYNDIASIQPGSFNKTTKLSIIQLYNNNIRQIARGAFLSLTKLQSLFLSNNNIDLIEAGAFANLPNLTTLHLDNNQLQYLLIDELGYLPALQTLQINNNNIKLLEKNLFTVCCPVLKTLYAYNNELTSISEGMFNGFYHGDVWLYSNQLTTLDEDWLGPPLRNSTFVTLPANPLDCGCDMAWLYAEPLLMTNLTATCSNGTDIRSLDPSWFSNSC